MFWIPLMMAASSLMQSGSQNGSIKAQNITNKSDTKIANMQQAGNSLISSAKGALSRFNQSVQTQDAMRQYGDANNQIEDQKAALGEQMTTGSFMNRLSAAHEAGALAARSSASGVGGSTITMIGATNALTADIDQAQMDEQYSNQLFKANQAEEDNLFDELGITAKQNVYLDDVAAADIAGPAKIPSVGMGQMMIQSAITYLGAAQSVGQLNGVGSKLKGYMSGTGANSSFQLGGKF